MEPDLGALGVNAINLFNTQQGEIPFTFLGAAHLAGNKVTRAKVKAPDLGRGNIDIIIAGEKLKRS
ncbi:MAG: hypothetical protein BWY80_01400 [Firmicutes bacterium ADurb.Bin456]|nr:MAG: hypothetical protein BWY80_01400 [Firmicutes bacterium ADurb.Bin456]